jgi:hypothetical protein
MLFLVVGKRFQAAQREYPHVALVPDAWNDYGYVTQFAAVYAADTTETPLSLGNVKVLQKGAMRTTLPREFRALDDSFASLGQDIDYYRRLNELPAEIGTAILVALRDLAADPAIAEEFRYHPGYERSLLRMAEARRALRDGSGVLRSAPPLVGAWQGVGPLAFTYSCHLPGFSAPHRLDIKLHDGPGRLGRMMALVGNNGTGKTRLLAALARSLSGLNLDVGRLMPDDCHAPVVTFSFSAFDQFTRPHEQRGSYAYYGLRRPPPAFLTDPSHPRAHGGAVDLEYAFERLRLSLEALRDAPDEREREDWRDLLQSTHILDGGPLRHDPFDGDQTSQFVEHLRGAGSGHQMIVFLATAFVESVRPGTVVLFDEPETHLHPGLLATLMRLLYDGLERRQAFAILATHSPVVLQEIPSRSIRILRLEGRVPSVSPYARESFGENLGDIVAYAFDVNEADKSYATILRALARTMPRADVEALFDGQLGLGARLLLREQYRSSKIPSAVKSGRR